jgi:TorA maturation chaperone TorD
MGAAREDIAETATARSHVYGLLAGVFRAEPTAALVEHMRSAGFSEALSGLGLALGDEFHAASCEQLVEDLALEYTRLFIGPGPQLSPHESVHVDSGSPSDNTLWGPQTVEVKRFIEATGLRYEDRFTGLPDHISAEFELMQKLAERQSRAWSEGEEGDAEWCREVQKRFLEDHLGRWVPGFCDKIVDQASSSFYREMASLTKAFLQFEQTALERATDGARGARQ